MQIASVHNQQTNISFKNKKKVRKPVDEWFKVENTHEAIISEEDFRRVQEMIDTRRRSQKNGKLQLFSGLIKCADCGWSLGHGRRKTKNGYDGYYHCSKNGQGLHQYTRRLYHRLMDKDSSFVLSLACTNDHSQRSCF